MCSALRIIIDSRAQIEGRRKVFVPERQAEVQALKEELGQGSFASDGKPTDGE